MNARKETVNVLPLFSFKRMLLLVFVIIALVLAFLFFNHFKSWFYFPIKKVRIYGANHMDQQEVNRLILPLVDHNFFAVSVENIRDHLMQQAWVSNIAVRRHWPDQIEINVVEKRAVAHWRENSLLSATGELFSPARASYPQDLPSFVGPDGKQMEMLHYFNEMNRILLPLHAKISYLELTPYASWKIALNNGLTIKMGQRDILTRLDRFVKAYPKVVGKREADVAAIDLRYPHGVAVRFKTKA